MAPSGTCSLGSILAGKKINNEKSKYTEKEKNRSGREQEKNSTGWEQEENRTGWEHEENKTGWE
jgi:hypothetical protein